MKKIFILLVITLAFSCKNENTKKTQSKEDLILAFCKSDIVASSISPATIKYDSLLTEVYKIDRKFKYYNKDLDAVNGFVSINDTISKKWYAIVTYDAQNKYGALIRNNVIYVIKENTKYYQDTIFNEKFIILSKRDENKLHENLGIE